MEFEVIIIGGSYAGLQAAMTLGRALRKILIIDNSTPCNRQTRYSHNFLTRDGEAPGDITAIARMELKRYATVRLINDEVTSAINDENGFVIGTISQERFRATKILFATGVKDILPNIDGFSDCWGISILHCPYCHGYEFTGKPTGIIAPLEDIPDMVRMISNWTRHLTVFYDNASSNSIEIDKRLAVDTTIDVSEKIKSFHHIQGQLTSVELQTGRKIKLDAIYARLRLVQHSDIPQNLGCKLDKNGLLTTDGFSRTAIKNIYAAGDNCNVIRSLDTAVNSGMLAGAFINKDLIEHM